MRLAVMQPYFFPYLGQFQLIDAADKFLFSGNVTFRKNSWISRNQLQKRGAPDPSWIRVPVKNQSSYALIRTVEISDNNDWRTRILNQAYFYYKKAHYFNDVYPEVEKMVMREETNLAKYNVANIRHICNLIGIDTPIMHDDDAYVAAEKDLEARAQASGLEPRVQRVVDICKIEGATAFLNPPGGVELYRKEDLAAHGIDLRFVGPSSEAATQLGRPLISIIDTLMHAGFEGTHNLLSARQES